jgi:hypothetical protein
MGGSAAAVCRFPGHSPTENIGSFDGDRQRQNFHRGSHALDAADMDADAQFWSALFDIPVVHRSGASRC